MNTYLMIAFRIVSIMLLLLASTLLIMGKRPIGELPVFDLLTLVVMGSIVGADIAQPEIKHLPTAFAVVVLAVMQRCISFLIVKSTKARRMITFEPTIVIQDGQILLKNLKSVHYTVDDLLMLLREKNVFTLNQIDFCIVEASGNISVLKKAPYETPTVQELGVSTGKERGLLLAVILEGKFQRKNMMQLNKEEEEIIKYIRMFGYSRPEEIFVALMDPYGQLHISPYEK
ncbi:DUF421 domain-containing protein [Geosporobacter ferrireducens]|uniref:DUF421 domain-containing protein n=1 Tax=Geosporobacter ferrireducens TaxID=1424294 RepID=UPI00139CB391|nr:DUF421 domain-containing protein [Geosporobacter ferrireducens]MTI54844.1 DUF421 domain-containing protein [Geosporobacter ferrireducens]